MPCIVKVKVVGARDLPVMDTVSQLTDAFIEVRTRPPAPLSRHRRPCVRGLRSVTSRLGRCGLGTPSRCARASSAKRSTQCGMKTFAWRWTTPPSKTSPWSSRCGRLHPAPRPCPRPQATTAATDTHTYTEGHTRTATTIHRGGVCVSLPRLIQVLCAVVVVACAVCTYGGPCICAC
jgi:hypothetical protein